MKMNDIRITHPFDSASNVAIGTGTSLLKDGRKKAGPFGHRQGCLRRNDFGTV